MPPIALLAAVHGIALAVRAGASGRVYGWAVGATAAIGAGAFAVSFLALCDLSRAIGYSSATAWAFPAIIDTTVAVATVMLVFALGDKPARRKRTATTPASTQDPSMQRAARNTKPEVAPVRSAESACTEGVSGAGKGLASVQLDPAQTVRSAQAEAVQRDADLASELIASGVTTQPIETVIAVLAASRNGTSINAAAKASGINYRTAQRIVQGAAEREQGQLAGVG